MTRPVSQAAATTPLEMLSRRTELLFTQDVGARLLRLREPDGACAPRFYLARSPLGNVWRLRADLPLQAIVGLARLAGRERPLDPPAVAAKARSHASPPPERAEAFRQVLREHGEIDHEYRGPVYRFPEASRADGLPAGVVRLTPSVDRVPWLDSGDEIEEVLSRLAATSKSTSRAECFAIVEGGEVLSACWTSRFLAGFGAEAGVHTREAHRGKGLALRVVSAWSLATRHSGVEPFYSTEWGNRASRAVARRLGLRFCGEDWHLA